MTGIQNTYVHSKLNHDYNYIVGGLCDSRNIQSR